MDNISDIQSWFIYSASNCKNDTDTNFYIVAIIPEDIKNLLMTKQDVAQIYLGCIIRVFIGETSTNYYLHFYTVEQDSETVYKIGYSSYELLNIDIDWISYINSSDFYPLPITPDNLDLTKTNFCEGLKVNFLYGLTNIFIDTSISLYSSTTQLFCHFLKISTTVSNYENLNYYTSTLTLNIFSVTPSVTKFAGLITTNNFLI